MSGYHERLYPVERVLGGVATGSAAYAAGAVAPHVATVRWVYTVPTATAAEIENWFIHICRDAVAAPPGQCFATIYYGGANYLDFEEDYRNGVGDQVSARAGLSGFLRAGEVMAAQTADASTGGSHTFALALHYREFAI